MFLIVYFEINRMCRRVKKRNLSIMDVFISNKVNIKMKVFYEDVMVLFVLYNKKLEKMIKKICFRFVSSR